MDPRVKIHKMLKKKELYVNRLVKIWVCFLLPHTTILFIYVFVFDGYNIGFLYNYFYRTVFSGIIFLNVSYVGGLVTCYLAGAFLIDPSLIKC